MLRIHEVYRDPLLPNALEYSQPCGCTWRVFYILYPLTFSVKRIDHLKMKFNSVAAWMDNNLESMFVYPEGSTVDNGDRRGERDR